MTKELRHNTREFQTDGRTISGYALVFDSPSNDLGGFVEVIKPGALDGVLERSDILFLLDHNADRGVLGRSKYGSGSLSLKVDDTGLYFECEAPATALGDEVIEGIRRGDITSCSFAFSIEEDEWVKVDGQYTRNILKFKELYDISVVYTPAYPDTSVALRSYKINQITDMSKREDGELTVEEKIAQLEAMKENETDQAVLAEIDKQIEELKRSEPCEEPEEPEKDEEAERERKLAKIRAIVGEPSDSKLENQDKIDELKDKLDDEDDPEVKEEIEKQIDELEARKQNKTTTTHMTKKFSLLAAIRDIAEGRSLDDAAKAVVEAGQKEMRKAGLNANGQIVLPVEYRDGEGEGATVPDAIVAKQAVYGKEAVAVDKLNILGPLRNKMVMSAAGATYMTGLTGDVNIPFYSGSNAQWKDELQAAADGKGTFSDITLSPKRLTTKIVLSKQFLLQDSVGANSLIHKDIVDAIAEKLESTILGNAAGSNTQPAGIFNGVTADTSDLTFGKLVDIEKAVEETNVTGAPCYIVNPAIKATLRQTSVGGSKSDLRMIFDNNEINGVKTLVTKNSTGLVYGDFSEYVIACWGGISLTVDPYSMADRDCVVLVVNAYFDSKLRRPGAIKAYVPKA